MMCLNSTVRIVQRIFHGQDVIFNASFHSRPQTTTDIIFCMIRDMGGESSTLKIADIRDRCAVKVSRKRDSLLFVR